MCGGVVTSIIIEELENVLEDLHGDIYFLLALLCTDIKRKEGYNIFCEGDPTKYVFQCFCLFPLDTVYSAIFQSLICFQGADWESRERALRVACQLPFTPVQPGA